MAVFLALMCAFTENSNIGIQTKAHGIYAFVILYNAFYGATWGPMPWLLPAEVFPMRARSTGVAFSTCSNWYVASSQVSHLCTAFIGLTIPRIFNFVIGMSSPDAFASLGGYYYLIIMGFCLFSVGRVKLYYVETANSTLEELALVFGDRAFEDDADAVMRATGLNTCEDK